MKIIILKNSSMDSAQYAGRRFRTEAEARAAIREGLYPDMYAVRDATPEETKIERNKRQQAKRASPEAKAKEAQASRRRYWKKQGVCVDPEQRECCDDCSYCAKKIAKHALA